MHTGSAEHVAAMIRGGWIDVLFAGNALATHDIEQALYGTSLGVNILRGESIEHGHEHHLRTINTIRRRGGIKAAVEAGVLTSGIMYESVNAGLDVVLAGSIRDDGPLPEVITDTLAAQSRMRQAIRGVGFALMIATALHSVATGNLLPAWVKVVCVDINPATVTKLSDRGTFQTVGIVTDVEPFLSNLAAMLATPSLLVPAPRGGTRGAETRVNARKGSASSRRTDPAPCRRRRVGGASASRRRCRRRTANGPSRRTCG